MTAMTMDFTPRSFYVLQGAPGWQDAAKGSKNAGPTSAAKVDVDELAFQSARDIAQKRLASVPGDEPFTPKLMDLKDTLSRVSLNTAGMAGGLFQSLFEFLRRIFRAVVNTVCRVAGAQLHEGEPPTGPGGPNLAENSPAKEVAKAALKSCADIAKSLASDEKLFVRLAEESALGKDMTVLREGLGRAEKGLVELANELAQKTERFNELLEKESKELKSDKGMMRMLLSNGEKVGSDALVQAYRDMAALKSVERTFSKSLGVMIQGYGMDRVRDSKVLAEFPYAADLIKKFTTGMSGMKMQAAAPAKPGKQGYVGPVSPDPTLNVVPAEAPPSSVARPVFGRKVAMAAAGGPTAENDLDEEDSNVVRMRPQP